MFTESAYPRLFADPRACEASSPFVSPRAERAAHAIAAGLDLLPQPSTAIAWGSAVCGGFQENRSDVDVVIAARAVTADFVAQLESLPALREADICVLDSHALRDERPQVWLLNARRHRTLHPMEVFLIRNRSYVFHGPDPRHTMWDVSFSVANYISQIYIISSIPRSVGNPQWMESAPYQSIKAHFIGACRNMVSQWAGRALTKMEALHWVESNLERTRDGRLVRETLMAMYGRNEPECETRKKLPEAMASLCRLVVSRLPGSPLLGGSGELLDLESICRETKRHLALNAPDGLPSWFMGQNERMKNP